MAKRGSIKDLDLALNKRNITSAEEYTPIGRVSSLIIGIIIGFLFILFALLSFYVSIRDSEFPVWGILCLLVGIGIIIISVKLNKRIKKQDE
jgi:undecaprenyl pyrophosphate phosphatase UppP